MNHFSTQTVREIFTDAANALKAVSRNRIASRTRIALWNAYFPDSPISLATSLRHRLTTTLHQYISGGKADRFCFELSVLFFDLPTQFYDFTAAFPAPLSIAMRIAYKTVNSHLQKPDHGAFKKCVQEICETTPKEKLPAFKATLHAIIWDKSNSDKYFETLKNILDPSCFDAIIQACPPVIRLHYALKYNLAPPEVSIDYNNLSMPLEFLQAISCLESGREIMEVTFPEELKTTIS
ncbi:hypothetical protein TRFO_15981 [Tritrichomonas foetus]|uniref:Uncharacterized protein n=1 Tax=Tritrichomonas foetus TaxID=1144522 RepID=A0A1J4KSA9_9EUKA|nr:hypothetical protein TRFO_15981 [Tritrichomonas foetus]|eukprot:OHT13768.1 hypothetical protein TRFO_15981 [Tritrichomonas foetus]